LLDKSGGEILIKDIEAINTYRAAIVNIVLVYLVYYKVLGKGGSTITFDHLLTVSIVAVDDRNITYSIFPKSLFYTIDC